MRSLSRCNQVKQLYWLVPVLLSQTHDGRAKLGPKNRTCEPKWQNQIQQGEMNILVTLKTPEGSLTMIYVSFKTLKCQKISV